MNIGKNFDKKFSIDGLKEQTWYKMVLSQKQIGVKNLELLNYLFQ